MAHPPFRWGAVTRTGYRNYHPLGQALKRALARPAVRGLLPGYGWLDGGCLQLTDALVRWSGGGLEPGGALRRLSSGSPFLDHAFAFCRLADGTPVLWDGDGLHDEALFREKLRRREGAPWRQLAYRDCAREAYGIPRHRATSPAIAAALAEALGPYDPACLAVLRAA